MLFVDGQKRTIAELRSSYASGISRLMTQGPGIVSGDYTPQQVATVYKTGVTAFIGVNVRCGMDAEIPVRTIDERGEMVTDSPAEMFVANAPKFIWRLMAHQLIFGAIYIRKVRNRHGYPTSLEILSPLDVHPEINYTTGTIARYIVKRSVGMEYVKPCDMIVDLTFNPFSDVDGTSALEVSKIRSDIETSIGRYGAMFFANSARPDIAITTDADLGDEQERQKHRRAWEANFKGVLNSFRAAFLGGSNWKITPLGYNPVDLAMVDLTSQADMKILATLRVSPILAGIGQASDPLSAQGTYEAARTQHLEFVAIPDIRQLCNVLNEQWLHADFDGAPSRWTLEPDAGAILSSAMGTGDRVTTASAAVTGHVWSVNEAREHTGKEPLKYHIDINPDWALSAWQAGVIKRSQVQAAIGFAPGTINRTDPDGFIYEIDPRAKPQAPAAPQYPMFGNFPPGQNFQPPPEPPKQIAAPAPAEVKTIDVVPAARSATEACYVILSLANDPAIVAIQAELRGKYPGVEWSTPDSFHVTLVYSPQTADLNAVKQILPRSINEFSFEVGPVSSFEGKDKTPIILTVDAPVELAAIQAGLAASFEALGLTLSEYSAPDAWSPHVTLGYAPQGVALPESDRTATVSSATIICSIEAGESFQNVYVTRAKVNTAAQLHELGLWRKRVKAKGTRARFNVELLPSAVASWVRANLEHSDDPGEVFDEAREWLRSGQEPSTVKPAGDPLPVGAATDVAPFTPEEIDGYFAEIDKLKGTPDA